MATLDNTTPEDGVPADKPTERDFKTGVKGRIDGFPDALDPGGNECTALVGRHYRVGANGGEAGGNVDMDGAELAGFLAVYRAITASVTINSTNANDWNGRILYNSSGSNWTLTLDATLPTGFNARVVAVSGTVQLAESASTSKPFLNGGAPVVLQDGESALIGVGPTFIEVFAGVSL